MNMGNCEFFTLQAADLIMHCFGFVSLLQASANWQGNNTNGVQIFFVNLQLFFMLKYFLQADHYYHCSFVFVSAAVESGEFYKKV